MMTPEEIEIKCIKMLRQKYMPDRVKMLFVGEAPPDKCKRFFYWDKDDNVKMTTYIKKAFEKAHCRKFENNYEFLRYFEECSCYLDDISHKPGKLDGKYLKEDMHIMKLADRIKNLKPATIVVVMKNEKIVDHVTNAADRAGLKRKPESIYFPGWGWQKKR